MGTRLPLWTRLTTWLNRSVRNKLLAMALLPLCLALPLLMLALILWSHVAYDRLLITKVRSDLAVARGYFEQVRGEIGAGVDRVASSAALAQALAAPHAPALQQLLMTQREQQGLDFLNLYTPQGELITRDRTPDPLAQQPLPLDPGWGEPMTRQNPAAPGQPSAIQAQVVRLGAEQLRQLAPHLGYRAQIQLIPTRGARPTDQTRDPRALLLLATLPVHDAQGQVRALLRGGVLLNQNLALVDHINRIVYPDGALPFDSQGTATLFMDDVRITTNVRLFQDERAIGTRVSHTVSDAVLGEGRTWLDRAFVVNDWYVSAYEPLLDARKQRVGMLYVGFLEGPFRWVRYAMLAVMGLIFLGVMAFSAHFSLRWARSIFRPVEQMNLTMRRVEDGDATARVGVVAAQDEIGQLANHLDQLLDVIGDKTAALQRWGQELDQKVAERTRELQASHQALQQTQQQLVRSEKLAAIGQLTASVAHEINNPIAVIQGNMDVIRDSLGAAAGPIHQELRLVDQQVERMRLIVTQLLQYARPNDYAGYAEPLWLGRVAEDSLVLVTHLLSSHHVVVQSQWQDSHRVSINRQELQQVLINLIVNAAQAMPRGGTLRLRTQAVPPPDTQAPPGPWMAIEIEDEGPGIAPELAPRLFQPFATTKAEGNGLGLWVSLGIVERYNGRIDALPRADGQTGACFRVSLPAELA